MRQIVVCDAWVPWDLWGKVKKSEALPRRRVAGGFAEIFGYVSRRCPGPAPSLVHEISALLPRSRPRVARWFRGQRCRRESLRHPKQDAGAHSQRGGEDHGESEPGNATHGL